MQVACTIHTKHCSRQNTQHTDIQWLKRNICRSNGCHVSHLSDHFDTVFENTTPNMPPSSLRKEHVDEKGNLLNVKVIEWQETKWKNARNDMRLNNSKLNNTEWAKKKKKRYLSGCRAEVEVKIMKPAFPTTMLRKRVNVPLLSKMNWTMS